MTIAIFDLDHTLIDGDSDELWGQYVVHNDLVSDPDAYAEGNQRFYDDYCRGELNIHAYTAFLFQSLKPLPMAELQAHRDQYVASIIEPIVKPGAVPLLERHRIAGDELLICTSTNSFITGAIAELLGISTLIATEPEIENDRFTGNIVGVPCLSQGKVEHLNRWIAEQALQNERTIAYSDSHNDIPMLEWADEAVVVDGDEKLLELACSKQWLSISLRDTGMEVDES